MSTIRKVALVSAWFLCVVSFLSLIGPRTFGEVAATLAVGVVGVFAVVFAFFFMIAVTVHVFSTRSLSWKRLLHQLRAWTAVYRYRGFDSGK